MIDYHLAARPRGLENPEGYPEGVLHLWANRCGRPRCQREYKWPHYNWRENGGSRIQIVEHAEALGARQVYPHFLERFADRRREEIGVGGFAPAARERDLSRPRVARPHGAMDEEGFEAVVAIVQHHRDSRGNHPRFEWNFGGAVAL